MGMPEMHNTLDMIGEPEMHNTLSILSLQTDLALFWFQGRLDMLIA